LNNFFYSLTIYAFQIVISKYPIVLYRSEQLIFLFN